jgi:hypothetical protein
MYLNGQDATLPLPIGVLRALLIVLEDADGPEEAGRMRAVVARKVRQRLVGGSGWEADEP